MDRKRRDFLKMAVAASASLLPVKVQANTDKCQSDFDDVFGVLVDTTVCIGCRQCEEACNRQNKLTDNPASFYADKTVFKEHRRPSTEAFTVVNPARNDPEPVFSSFAKVQCMHCNQPACVSACIVGALSKCPRGPVMYDAWKCIGCRYCMVACPFQIPAYEYDKAFHPRVRKCTLCSDRLREGQKPACVEACPVETLTFGKRGELLELAHAKIAEFPDRYLDHVYGEHEIGGTSWMYLASKDFAQYDLPAFDSDPIPERTETIQHGIFKSFLPPIALYGLLGLVMYSLRSENKATGDKKDA